MQIQFKGNGSGLDIRLKVTWAVLVTFIIGTSAVITALLDVMPKITQLGSLIGW